MGGRDRSPRSDERGRGGAGDGGLGDGDNKAFHPETDRVTAAGSRREDRFADSRSGGSYTSWSASPPSGQEEGEPRKYSYPKGYDRPERGRGKAFRSDSDRSRGSGPPRKGASSGGKNRDRGSASHSRGDAAAAAQSGERLQKLIARAEGCARRDADERIAAGLVQINGQLALPGTRVSEGDRVQLAEQSWTVQFLHWRSTVLAYHKPPGEVVATADDRFPTVFSALPPEWRDRVKTVGRLDVETAGLLLFTDDGDLAARLMHPRHKCLRLYLARVTPAPSADALELLQKGVDLEDGRARFSSLEALGGGRGINAWFKVSVAEGRNRLVRRLWESQGSVVSRLKRIAYSTFELPPSLARGCCQPLSAEEVEALYEAVSLERDRGGERRLSLIRD